MSEDSKTRCHKRLWHRDQWSHYRYQAGWWPLVGVQRNIVNVSLLHVRWITRDNGIQATGHSPRWATTTTVCDNITISLHHSDLLVLFFSADYCHCHYCIQWWNSNRLIVSNWFTPRHFYFWQKSQNCGAVSLTTLEYLFLSLALTNERRGLGPSRGGQLGSFILCLPPTPALI